MIPVIIIRPEPACGRTVRAAQALGLNAQSMPLFAVEALPWKAVDSDSFDAILVGSANALRYAGPTLRGYAGKPAYVVGSATAQTASEVGLEVIAVGQGGLQSVLDKFEPHHCRVLRLTGEENLSLEFPEGIEVHTRAVYHVLSQSFPQALVQMLSAPALVLLHSGAAALHFAVECDRCQIDRSQISLAVIGPRVAPMAGHGWARLGVAAMPYDAALLALARDMCQ